MIHYVAYLTRPQDVKDKIREEGEVSMEDLRNYVRIVKADELWELRQERPRLLFHEYPTYDDAARIYYRYVSETVSPTEFDSLRFKSAELTDVEIQKGRIDIIPMKSFNTTRDYKFIDGNVFDLVTYYNIDYDYRIDMLYSDDRIHYAITWHAKHAHAIPHTLDLLATFSQYIPNIHIAVPSMVIGNAFEFGWAREWANPVYGTKKIEQIKVTNGIEEKVYTEVKLKPDIVLHQHRWKKAYLNLRNNKINVYYGNPRGISIQVKALMEDHIFSNHGAKLANRNEAAYYRTANAITTDSLPKLKDKYIISEVLDFR